MQTMNEKEWLSIFKENLLEMMYEKNISRRELARRSGISESAISCYLNEKRIPSVKALINISEVLECSLDDLMFFGDIIK